MSFKLVIILSIIFILGFGYSNYLPTMIRVGEREYVQSHLPTTVETITILLLLAVIISFWLIERKNNSSVELIFKMLGSLLLPASLISIFLLVLYRIQFNATNGGTTGVERIGVLRQTLSTDGAAAWLVFIVLVFSIIYLAGRNYLSASSKNIPVSFWKPFIFGATLSLVLGIIVGSVLASGHHGESGLIGIIIPIAYLVGGLVVSLITASIFRLKNKGQLVS